MGPSLSPCLSSGNHSLRLFLNTSKVLTAKSITQLLGQHSSTVWAVRTHREFPLLSSKLQLQWATAGFVEEKSAVALAILT